MKSIRKHFNILILFCLFIAIAIILHSLTNGTIFPSKQEKEKITITGNQISVPPLIIDASFDIQEADVRLVTYINSTKVTYEDLQIYPELESYLHGVNNDPGVWHSGWRYVTSFEGNMSRYDAFVKKICQGKTIFECCHGTLIEYHDQFYHVGYMEYGMLGRTPDMHTPKTPAPPTCPSPVNASPWIHIEPVADHIVGDNFSLTGTTNMESGTILSVFVHQSPASANKKKAYTDVRGTAVVRSGACNVNTWSFSDDLTTLLPSPYSIYVTAENATIEANLVQFYVIDNGSLHPSEEFVISVYSNGSIQKIPHDLLVAHGYADIPDKISPELAPVIANSSFSGDISNVAHIALRDPCIQKLLREDGFILGVDYYIPFHGEPAPRLILYAPGQPSERRISAFVNESEGHVSYLMVEYRYVAQYNKPDFDPFTTKGWAGGSTCSRDQCTDVC